jgi:TRAP-type mannitol/chloroaromatic compound transport system substrate-binding protein
MPMRPMPMRPMPMHRRKLLAAGAAAAVATAPLPTPAIAQGRVEWRMVTTWPKGFPGPGTAAERFAASVAAATGGRLTIKVFGAGEIVPPFECFDAVTRGAADLFHGTPYYWVNKSRALNFFATIPFGMAWGTACGDILAEMRDAADPVLAKVARSYLAARRDLVAWNRVATQGFMNGRLLDYRYG